MPKLMDRAAGPISQAPLTLFLDLEDDQVADLEVVARAALAWAEAIREVAYYFDPSIEIKVEIESGTTGSFSLNSIFRALKEKMDNPVTISAVVLCVIAWFGLKTADKEFDHLWALYVGSDPVFVELTLDQMNQVADKVANALAGRVAHPQVQRVYREIERDPAIKGVGVSPVHGQRPRTIVPRDQFQERAGRSEALEYTGPTERIVSSRMWVGLIKPVLVAHERRSWGLRASTGNFTAMMKATNAVDRMLTGQTPIPMVAGIEMEIELEAKERLVDGVWMPKERSVTQIYGWRFPPTTGELFPAPGQDQ